MSSSDTPADSVTSEPPVIARVRRLGEHVGKIVTVQGWLSNRRSSGKLQFLQVRDGSGTVQMLDSAGWIAVETSWIAGPALCWNGLCAQGDIPLD